MNIPHRALGIVREIVLDLGHEVTYAYDDLMFIDHNAYLLQFTESPDRLNLYFNVEAGDDFAEETIPLLTKAAKKRDMKIERKGHYELAPKDGGNFDVRFFNRQEA